MRMASMIPRRYRELQGWSAQARQILLSDHVFLRRNGEIPAYREVGQKILDLFTNMGAKTKVTDSQSGFRALSCQALDNLDFRSDGYNIESDMIAHFSAIGLSIMEVPISVNYDVPNKHKKHPVTHGVGVLTRLVNLIGYRRPLLAFGIPGFLLIIGGMIAEIWVLKELVENDVFHYVLAIGSAFVLITGMLLVIAGLILNTLVMMMKETRRVKNFTDWKMKISKKNEF